MCIYAKVLRALLKGILDGNDANTMRSEYRDIICLIILEVESKVYHDIAFDSGKFFLTHLDVS
jgi:hypothetical protein